MAYILESDVSNLSKYERAKLYAPSHVVLSYHILSKIPLERLLRKEIKAITPSLVQRVKCLLEDVEQEESSTKNKQRIVALGRILERVDLLSCPNEFSV